MTKRLILPIKFCLHCKNQLILNNTRDIMRKKYCSYSCRQKYRYNKGEFIWMKEMQFKASTPESNLKKSLGKGENHPNWIKDRTKLKQKRSNTEEKEFFKEIFKDRNYTCELTGNYGGQLSIHHIKPVWKNPELIYDKNNVICILKSIHTNFHKIYGLKSNELDWIEFTKKEMK